MEKDKNHLEKIQYPTSRIILMGARVVRSIFPREKRRGIHDTVIIGKKCKIDEDVYIGPYTFIDDNVTIKKNVEISSLVAIFNKTIIEENSIISSGVVIGGESVGYEINEENTYEQIPQLKGVIIKRDVVINANTTIDRGAYRNTIIGKGTKVAGLVRVGHNVHVGENCLLHGSCILGGHSTIENEAIIGMNACVKQGVNVGRGAIVGMGAVVLKDVEALNVVVGNPAKFLKMREIKDD